MTQLYGADLQIIKTVKHEYTISITHKPTGITVNGKGDHDYALNARLMQELREKVNQRAEEASA